ncbi:MAG: polymerase, sigma-24 subunit, subfamily [Nocardioides sp.]|nr:polymerase, sigma-24 subunit, subfamily [Nocardioides sp.]
MQRITVPTRPRNVDVILTRADGSRMTSRDASHQTAHPGFEAWVGAHADSLARFALLVVGNQAGADDALQEALSRACPRWDRIVRADNPNAYVRRMVVNAHISWWRRARRRESPVADTPDTTDPWAVVGPEGADGDLWQACARLPRRQRAVVVLRYYEGLSYAEVAELLGVAEVTARSQTHRALKTLRTFLEESTDV